MNRELIDKVANAVLYEGYILYPYRASSRKNRQRFTFGRIYPEQYSAAQNGREPSLMQTECLLQNESKDALAQIEVRFLHPIAREVARTDNPADETSWEFVPELRVDQTVYQTWHEATERQIELPAFSLGEPLRKKHPFDFPASRTLEPVRNSSGELAGLLVRKQQELRGEIEIATDPIDDVVMRLTVRIQNLTPVPAAQLHDQHGIVMQTFASTHTLIWTEGGECLSLLDPPSAYVNAAKECKNVGCFPVLVGDETKNERDAILSSPIILYDYPQIAPESAGDLFDGLEIDEILTLRVQAMTDEEKAEMRHIDEHARRILERTELMSDDHLLKMHGTIRDKRSLGEDFFNPAERRNSVTVNGVQLKAGDRVRIRPKRRADAFDIVLAGKIAIIEAVEEDVQNQVHLALVLEDDPGRELGFARQPGHRFFYGADEVEPIVGQASDSEN